MLLIDNSWKMRRQLLPKRHVLLKKLNKKRLLELLLPKQPLRPPLI